MAIEIKEEELNYDTAFDELKKIVQMLQSKELDIEALSSNIKRAQELKEFCYNRLREIEEDINQTINQ
jgi:exodeoxyribonuclease VII small subunit